MAQTKEFFTRIQHKHDIEANWIKAINFTPLNGEIIVYDKDDTHDYARIKIGDGVTKINELHFMLNDSVLITEQDLTDEQRAQARANISQYGDVWTKITNPAMEIADFGVLKYGNTPSFDMNAAINKPSERTSSWCSVGEIVFSIGTMLTANAESAIMLMVKRAITEFDALYSSGILTSDVCWLARRNVDSFPSEIDLAFYISGENGNLNGTFSYTHMISIMVGQRIGNIYYNSSTEEYNIRLSVYKNTDLTLTHSNSAADAKAVGDALATKVSFTEAQELTDEQKEIARTNIGVITDTYATKTELTEATTDLVYFSEENQEAATVPLNADTWSGYTPTAFLNLVYPIGSIYMSVNNVNPATLFGGTWEQIKDRFLLSAGSTYSAGSTGGAATVTLTAAQMPKHRHTTALWNNAGTKANAKKTSGYGANVTDATSGLTGTWGSWQTSTFQVAGSGYGDPNGITDVAGNGVAHNNMPPYLAVYVWKRTA